MRRGHSLFEAVNLRLWRAVHVQDSGVNKKLMQDSGDAKKKNTEIIDDEQEVEVEKSEKLTENESDFIYNKRLSCWQSSRARTTIDRWLT